MHCFRCRGELCSPEKVGNCDVFPENMRMLTCRRPQVAPTMVCATFNNYLNKKTQYIQKNDDFLCILEI